MPLGYWSGQPFGDPAQFTRSTQESEIDRFNDWLRQQPWHVAYLQQIGQYGKAVNLSERQQKDIAAIARQNGVPIAKAFSFDQGGNLNQNSRTVRNLAIGGAAAAAAFGIPAIAGMGGAGAAGVGETVGLAGSGFGTGGGLGFALPAGASLAGAAGATGAAGAGAAAAAARRFNIPDLFKAGLGLAGAYGQGRQYGREV